MADTQGFHEQFNRDDGIKAGSERAFGHHAKNAESEN